MAARLMKKGMTKKEKAKLITTANQLKAIAHPCRLMVLKLLNKYTTLSVSEILTEIDIEQSLLSHHLAKMKNSGILCTRKKGRNIYYQLSLKHTDKLLNWIG